MSVESLDDCFGDLNPVGFFRIDTGIERDILKGLILEDCSLIAVLQYNPVKKTFNKVYITSNK